MNKVKKFLKSTAGMVLIVTILPDQGSGFCYPCWIRTDHCAADRRY